MGCHGLDAVSGLPKVTVVPWKTKLLAVVRIPPFHEPRCQTRHHRDGIEHLVGGTLGAAALLISVRGRSLGRLTGAEVADVVGAPFKRKSRCSVV
jgi:hypothetical protein